MTIRNLNHLFRPKSVALVGASAKPHSVGATVLTNLLQGGFSGAIMAVNPKYKTLDDLPVYPNVKALPTTPDLAVICTPPATIPRLIAELGERGVKAAIVLTAGLNQIVDRHGVSIKSAMLDAARPHLLRILGPNCVGLLVPVIGLNASFAHTNALPGKLAFVSQSGALTTAVLDWANSKNIGFSHFISLGDSADVDFGDVLDYLGSDPDTGAILLYVESIRAARKFMSAARAAARNKPVLLVKAGRAPEGAKAAASHTGALAGSDNVYDAAIRRAGMLRVYSMEDLFNAAETLARSSPISGDRLTIMTNGGGAGVLAADALALGEGKLASLSDETLRKLDEVLPSTWSHGNPVDIIGDAPVERYVDTLKILQKDPQTDAILFIQAPTAIVPSKEIATALSIVLAHSPHNVFACWLGGDAVTEARKIFRQAGIPTYNTPEQAAWAFLQVVNYRRNQELLMQTPPSAPVDFAPAVDKAREVVRAVLASGRKILTEVEAKDVLAAYNIPVVETRVARTPEEAEAVARELGFPVAVKILSPDITHKSDVGGVALDQESAEAVRVTADAMRRRLGEHYPQARLTGFTVQRMARRTNAFELIVGVATDPVFGPVILFGQGGTAVEVIADRAIGLPPLNFNLASDLVSRTRISKLLAGYRDRPPVDHAALHRTLTQVSQLVCDIPEIVELDINPLLVDENGVIALDARIGVAPAAADGYGRLAIHPYPKELEEWIEWDGKRIMLRPIRPEDEPGHTQFFDSLTPEDVRFRFFGSIRQLAHSQMARLTQIDYDREMAFVAVEKDNDGHDLTLGVARAVTDPDNVRAEFAIIMRSDMKGRGLGAILLKKIIRYCRDRGTQELVGQVLAENTRMRNLAKNLGFTAERLLNDNIVGLRLALQ
jgi:acetyltransferase